jgi:LPS-assembly protein
MLRNFRTLVVASTFATIYCVPVLAETTTTQSDQETQDPFAAFDQCQVNTDKNQETEQLPTQIDANSLIGTKGGTAQYQGDVVVTQGDKRLRADSVTLHQTENIVVAEGNVVMTDGQIKTESEKTTTNLNTEESTIEQVKYNLLCESGRGDAAIIHSSGKAFYELEDGSLTACPEGDNSWRLTASSIEIDQAEESAKFYNPKFEIFDVPVFYLPYMTMPIGNERKTGVLYPTVAYGTRDGIEAEVPVYWNLAPNYDLLTTFKYMELRGLQVDSEFRHLSTLGNTDIELQYLMNDRLYTEYDDRWGVGISHNGYYAENWKFSVDYSQVSDVDFFRDIDSSIGEREDGQLLQEGYVSYRNRNWDTSLRVRSFQVLTTDSELPYMMLPQLEANYYAPAFAPYLDFDLVSHLTNFKTEDDSGNKPTEATRVHIEPGLTLPLVTTWGSLTTEARLLATHYEQNLTDYTGDYELDDSVTRVLPKFSSTASLYLEKESELVDGYLQTLEPQIQYLYVPDSDQDNIYVYDTTSLQGDFYNLFRTTSKSGVDRVVQANQISYGATTRFYDSDYKERFNLAIGQIFHVDDSYEDLSNEQLAWALEADFNFSDELFYHGGAYYSVDSKTLHTANSTLEYRFNGGYLQTNYRYVTKEYIEETVGENVDVGSVTNDGISQAGLIAGYRFNRNWNLTGQYYHDMTEDIALESMASLRYTSDCWYIGLTYTDLLRTNDVSSSTSNPEYEQNLAINFGIIGFGTSLGSDSGEVGTAAGFDSAGAALSYGRPFYLNN